MLDEKRSRVIVVSERVNPQGYNQRPLWDGSGSGQNEQGVSAKEFSPVRYQADTQVHLIDLDLVMACNPLGCFPFTPRRRLPIVNEHPAQGYTGLLAGSQSRG